MEWTNKKSLLYGVSFMFNGKNKIIKNKIIKTKMVN